MSKIFDALRKAERDPSPLMEPTDRASSGPKPHPRRVRTYEQEFGSLSNAVQSYFPKARRGKVILVIGCVDGEGATYVSSHLAKTLARDSGAPILYMDANFHDPGIRQEFGVNGDRGLSDVAQEGEIRELSKVLHPSDVDQLYLLAGGRSRVSPVAYFNSPHFEKSIEALKRTFKFVIVDGPPLLKHPDAMHLATHCDGVVMVVKHKHLAREIVRKGIDMIESVEAPILGAVLNKRRFSIPRLIYNLIS